MESLGVKKVEKLTNFDEFVGFADRIFGSLITTRHFDEFFKPLRLLTYDELTEKNR